MVGQRLRPLFSIVGDALKCSGISRSLPSFTILYGLLTFRAVCFGHKLDTTVFDLKKILPCKVLKSNE